MTKAGVISFLYSMLNSAAQYIYIYIYTHMTTADITRITMNNKMVDTYIHMTTADITRTIHNEQQNGGHIHTHDNSRHNTYNTQYTTQWWTHV